MKAYVSVQVRDQTSFGGEVEVGQGRDGGVELRRVVHVVTIWCLDSGVLIVVVYLLMALESGIPASWRLPVRGLISAGQRHRSPARFSVCRVAKHPLFTTVVCRLLRADGAMVGMSDAMGTAAMPGCRLAEPQPHQNINS